MEQQRAFQIEFTDNVATALTPLKPGDVALLGDAAQPSVIAVTDVPVGHKIALCDLVKGDPLVKYGVVIGQASSFIHSGSWVHLHCMHSVYDERSSHLDSLTGAPTDIKYE